MFGFIALRHESINNNFMTLSKLICNGCIKRIPEGNPDQDGRRVPIVILGIFSPNGGLYSTILRAFLRQMFLIFQRTKVFYET